MAFSTGECSRVLQKDQFLWAWLLSFYVLKFMFPRCENGLGEEQEYLTLKCQ